MDKLKPANVLMQRDGTQAEVANNESVEIMRGLGWEVVGEQGDDKSDAKAGTGEMTAKQLRAALDEKGISYAARASKADLQALLDAA
jgi:hypothetical protein